VIALAEWQILTSSTPPNAFNWSGVVDPTVLPELARVAASRATPRASRQEALGLTALCDVEQGQWQPGIQAARAAVRLGPGPSTAIAWAALGYGLLDSQGNAAARPARRALLQAARWLPHDFMLWYTLAQVDKNTNHLARAAREAARAVTLRDELSADGDGGVLAVMGSQQESGGLWPIVNNSYAYGQLTSLDLGIVSSMAPPLTVVSP
jgi:hypothetical protein